MSRKVQESQHTIVVCTGSDCRKKGARDLLRAARRALKKLESGDSSAVVSAKCCGLCKQAPVACIDGANWMGKVKPKALRKGIAQAAPH